MVWVDLNGHRLKGVRTIGAGGGWWGGYLLATDTKPTANPVYEAYMAGADNGVLEIWGISRQSHRLYIQSFLDKPMASVEGLAIYNDLIAVSLNRTEELLFVNASSGKKWCSIEMDKAPQGLCFDKQGALFAIIGKQVVRYLLPEPSKEMVLPKPVVVIDKGLELPRRLTLDEQGNIYVSDDGICQQVKVFTPDGTFLRTIGIPGGINIGTYDPNRMQHPLGLAITPDAHLWVAENSFTPKRVSMWSLDGKLIQAFYGPTRYGGGGNLDPRNPSRFYYADIDAGMEFKLNWEKGETELSSIYYLPQKKYVSLPGLPQLPIYLNNHQYMTNLYTDNPVGGESIASFWLMRDDNAVPVAAIGQANDWNILKKAPYKGDWDSNNATIFSWSDQNADGQMQPEEVKYLLGTTGMLTIDKNMILATSLTQRYQPVFTANNIPVFDLKKSDQLFNGARLANTSGGGQVLILKDGWTVMTTPPGKVVSAIAGAKDGLLKWTYPCETIGLHASQTAPEPKYPGYLIGTTRILGLSVSPQGTREELWAINGNKGVVYLFTADGMFVATLFKDIRQGKAWPTVATRNVLLNDVSLHDECFYPTITQAQDGKVYLSIGMTTAAIVRVDGLSSITRIPDIKLDLTPELLSTTIDYLKIKHENLLKPKESMETLTITAPKTMPVVDGKLNDWENASWVQISDKIRAPVAISGDRIYTAYQTSDTKLFNNQPDAWQLLFKTGGALDLMLGSNPNADSSRTAAIAGDLRLLVTMVNGKPLAVLYLPVLPGDKQPYTFSSPWRSIMMDCVKDVSTEVQVAGNGGDYETSIPLSTLGIKLKPKLILNGDIGILRSDGRTTIQRLYWHNKESGLISDVPGEAMLMPQLWGKWQFAE